MTAILGGAALAVSTGRPEVLAAGAVLGPAAALAVESLQQHRGIKTGAQAQAALDPRD